MKRAHLRRLAGIALVLPLAATLVGGVEFMSRCEYDCGDAGGRGWFLLTLLCTPPAAAGVLVIARTLPMRGLGRRSTRLAGAALVAPVVACTLVLAGATIAAGVTAVNELTTEAETHRIGETEPSAYDRAQKREARVAWVAISGVLAVLTAGTALALWAAVSRTRRGGGAARSPGSSGGAPP